MNRSDEEIRRMVNRRRCLDEMGGYPWEGRPERPLHTFFWQSFDREAPRG